MVGSLWRESGLNWTDFLPEGEDVQAFISQQVGDEGFQVKKYQYYRKTQSLFICFLNTSLTQQADKEHILTSPHSCCPFNHLSLVCHSLITSVIQTETPVHSVGQLRP